MMKLILFVIISIFFEAAQAMSCISLFEGRSVIDDQAVLKKSIQTAVTNSFDYLDSKNADWISKNKCMCCHTTMSYLFSRGIDKKSKATMKLLEQMAKDSVLNQSRQPWYRSDRAGVNSFPTESVLNALALIQIDQAKGLKKLSPVALKSVEQIFDHISPEGKLHWLDFGLEPFESKNAEKWGNGLALLAIEMAVKFGDLRPQEPKYQLLKNSMLAEIEKLNLNEKSILIWADSMNGSVLSPQLRRLFIADLAKSQNRDGSFNREQFTVGGSKSPDVYATAMALVAFSSAQMQPQKAKRAAEWLLQAQKNQAVFDLDQPMTTWFTSSTTRVRMMNHLFSSDIATGFASLALRMYAEANR